MLTSSYDLIAYRMYLVGRKSNGLNYSDYIAHCALSLDQDMEFPTDGMLVTLIKLQRLAEEADSMWRSKTPDLSDEMGRMRAQMHIKAFQSRLEDCMPSYFLQSRTLEVPHSRNEADVARISKALVQSCYHFVNTSIHEMGLVLGRLTKSCHPPPSHTLHIDTLFTCLVSTKHHLDFLLTMSTADYRNLPITLWNHLIISTYLLYKLCLGSTAVPQWDARAARHTVALEDYLEDFRDRLATVCGPPRQSHSEPLIGSEITEDGSGGSGGGGGGSSSDDGMPLQYMDLFSLLPTMFADVRETYTCLVTADDGRNAASAVGAEDEAPHPLFSDDGWKRMAGRCPSTKYVGVREGTSQPGTNKSNNDGHDFESWFDVDSGMVGGEKEGQGQGEGFWQDPVLNDDAFV